MPAERSWPRLAPHEAELIEADALDLYAHECAVSGDPTPWDDAKPWVQALFREAVRDPIGMAQRLAGGR